VTHDAEDPILDACLDELLGAHQPPDLQNRILLRHRSDSLLPPSVVLPPRVEHQTVRIAANSRRSAKNKWSAPLIAVAILSVAVLVGLTMLVHPSATPVPEPVAGVDQDAGVTASNPDRLTADEEVVIDDSVPEIPDFSPLRINTDSLASQVTLVAPRMTSNAIVELINSAVRQRWQLSGVSPAPPVDDRQWYHRVFQRLLGRTPTDLEMNEFLTLGDTTRRSTLVAKLLNEPRYLELFATYIGDQLAAALLAAAPAPGRADEAALGEYLAGELRDETSLADVSRSLLTAVRQPGRPSEVGPSAFLLSHYDRESKTIAARSAEVFWGRQLLCAECHDHPGDPQLTQGAYWRWNAFFRQLNARRESPEEDWVLRDIDFIVQGDGRDSPVFYETSDGQIKAAYPSLPGQPEMARSGRTIDGVRRALLANQIVQSAPFREAMVNRVWAMVLRYGFTDPIDDMGPHNPPSHPQLLTQLGEQFASHQFQLKSLVEWIVLSEPFSRQDGSPEAGLIDTPEFGSQPLFSRNYDAQSLRVAAVDSLAALDAAQVGDQSPAVTTARVNNLTPEGDLAVPDSLLEPASSLTVDPRFERSFHRGPNSTVQRILDSQMPQTQKIDHLFLALLSRMPSTAERQMVDKILAQRNDQRRALSDIWWALFAAGRSR
jgi:hypothetical protein